MGRAERTFSWVGFAIGCGALALQAALTIPAAIAQGRSLPGAVEFLLSFFTILSNATLVAVHLAIASDARWLARLRRPLIRAAMTAVMLFVMIFYHIVLAPTVALQGYWRAADILLHYVTPLFYLAVWVAFAPHGRTRYGQIPLIVMWPLAYALLAVARGAIRAEYPYPVLNAAMLGLERVALNIAGLLLLFAALCAVVIAVDRRLGRGRPRDRKDAQ